MQMAYEDPNRESLPEHQRDAYDRIVDILADKPVYCSLYVAKLAAVELLKAGATMPDPTLSELFRIQLVDVRARVYTLGPNGDTPLSEISIEGQVEAVVEIPDDIQVPVPGLEGHAWFGVQQKARTRIEVSPLAGLTMSRPPSTAQIEAKALELYPVEDGSYPGVDRNAEARAAYLRGRSE